MVLRTVTEGWAPRSSLNRPIGPDRNFALVRGSIQQVSNIARDHDAKVNDVLLTGVAGGLRELLRGRGERVEGVVLRALVPVSLHRTQLGEPQGNLLGQMVVPLPIGVSDPGRRLRMIAAETAIRKGRARPRRGSALRSKRLQRAMLTLLARQRLANVYVANVPGPRVPLYLAGAPLLEVFPVVPLIGNLTLGVGAFSYDGQFNITAVGDSACFPDIDVFTQGVRDALQSLAAYVDGEHDNAGSNRSVAGGAGHGSTGRELP